MWNRYVGELFKKSRTEISFMNPQREVQAMNFKRLPKYTSYSCIGKIDMQMDFLKHKIEIVLF